MYSLFVATFGITPTFENFYLSRNAQLKTPSMKSRSRLAKTVSSTQIGLDSKVSGTVRLY